MPTFSLEKARSPALLVAPRSGAVEVAAFSAASGDKMVCNADLRPFSPADGTQMQLLSSSRSHFSPAELKKTFVSVGKCQACDSNLIATASMADVIETAGSDFHCPMCTAMVTPQINGMDLVSALAAEFSDDDDDAPAEDEDDDEGDGDDDADDEGGEDDDEGGEDDGDEYTDSANDDGDEEGDDADDDGDSTEDEDNTSDEDGEDETAAIRARMTRRRAYAADGVENERPGMPMGNPSDDAPDMDGQDPDMAENTSEDFDRAVAALRRDMRKIAVANGLSNERPGMPMGNPSDDAPDMDGQDPDMAENRSEAAAVAQFRRDFRRRYPSIKNRLALATDEEVDDDRLHDEELTPGTRDDGSDDEEVEFAAAQLRPFVKKALAAMGEDEQPIAGKPCDTDETDQLNEEARSHLRLRRGARPDGNYHLKGQRSRANLDDDSISDNNVEGDDTFEDDDNTPGTDIGDDDSTMQHDDEVTPGTEDDSVEMSAESIVNWAADKIEIVAVQSTPDVRWVYANGRPVATISKERAATTVQTKWDHPSLAAAFASVCARGLPKEEAKEFGFTPRRFKVQASEIMRNAIHNASRNSANTARETASKSIDAYKQSVRSAFIAALKGSYEDLKNPLRDTLVAKLSSLSVSEPRSVVDTAFASAAEAMITNVFAKADEIAAKPAAARNEVANFVATSAYQARVTSVGTELASKLAKGNVGQIAAGFSAPVKHEVASDDVSRKARMEDAIRSLRRF